MKTFFSIPALLLSFFSLTTYAQNECPAEPVELGNEVVNTTDNTVSFVPQSYGTSNKTATIGEKVIFWVHGLGGDESSWGAVAAKTSVGGAPGYPARKVVYCDPGSTSYDDTYGDLGAAATQLDYAIDQNDNLSTANSISFLDNIVIAHSQGGLVARTLDMLYDTDPGIGARKFSGLVTFGTPHQGAMILKNIRSGIHQPDMLTKFVNRGCPEVILGEELEGLYDGGLAQYFNVDDLLNDILNGVCDFATQSIIPFAINSYTGPITYDYEPGGSGLTSLQNFTHNNLDVVAFYGEEEEPVFWRTATSFVASDDPQAANQTPFYLGPGDDQQLVDFAEDERDFQLMKKVYWDGQEDYHWDQYKRYAWLSWTGVGALAAAYHYNEYYQAKDIKNAYHKGYLWYLNANKYWKEIIGARVHSLQTVGTTCECQYFDGSLPSSAAYGSGSLFTHATPNSANCDYNVTQVTLVKQCQTDPFNPNQCHCDYYKSYDGMNPTGNPVFSATESGGGCTGGSGTGYHPVSFWRRCNTGNLQGWVVNEYPNDGVVTAASAGGLTEALLNVSMDKINHQEMRNAEETRDALNKLFDGNLTQDPNINLDIFKVDPR